MCNSSQNIALLSQTIYWEEGVISTAWFSVSDCVARVMRVCMAGDDEALFMHPPVAAQ